MCRGEGTKNHEPQAGKGILRGVVASELGWSATPVSHGAEKGYGTVPTPVVPEGWQTAPRGARWRRLKGLAAADDAERTH